MPVHLDPRDLERHPRVGGEAAADHGGKRHPGIRGRWSSWYRTAGARALPGPPRAAQRAGPPGLLRLAPPAQGPPRMPNPDRTRKAGTTAAASPYPRPGFLGITATDLPTDWMVQGCEVVQVLSGAPAAAAGLVGS
jgi:hypothetical protein